MSRLVIEILRKFLFGTILTVLFLLPAPSVASGLSPREFATQRLRAEGFSERFIQALESRAASDEVRDRVVELNVLGFLGSRADYDAHYSKRAVRECIRFIKRYKNTLKRVKASVGVPPEVIAALLWVETKHGARTGSFDVPGVYLSLVQADHPDVLHSTFQALNTRAPASMDEYRQKVIDRSISKSNWALGELRALEKIHAMSPALFSRLTGSYAGAFGFSQFIPSSYLSWARSDRRGRAPDLFKMEDAIQSVAFYLKSNGWKSGVESSHSEALFHYNRAQGYVDVILKIADEVKAIKARKGKSHAWRIKLRPRGPDEGIGA